MNYPKDIKQIFDDLKVALHSDNRSNLQLKANGGNTILLVYPPREEKHYLEKISKEYPNETIIDLSEVFVDFIDGFGWSVFEMLYKEYNQDAYQLFRSSSHQKDFYSKIINNILEAESQNKIPILIRTGILFGTGIDNHMIMEDKKIRELKQPLIIMYPALLDGEDLKFLGFKLSSKYRSLVIH